MAENSRNVERFGKTKSVRITELRESPYQGRILREFTDREKLDEPSLKLLVESIDKNGMMVPILVRKVEGKNGYEIVDGHRRLIACKILHWDMVEVLIRNCLDHEAQLFSVICNTHRLNFGKIEMAIACRKIMDTGQFNTKKELSIAMQKDETYVGDLMNLINMDDRIIDDLVKNKSINDLRLLRAIRKAHPAKDNHSNEQWELYQRIINQHITRTMLQKELKQKKKAPQKKLVIQQFVNMITIAFPVDWSADQKCEFYRKLVAQLGTSGKSETSNDSIDKMHQPNKKSKENILPQQTILF